MSQRVLRSTANISSPSSPSSSSPSSSSPSSSSASSTSSPPARVTRNRIVGLHVSVPLLPSDSSRFLVHSSRTALSSPLQRTLRSRSKQESTRNEGANKTKNKNKNENKKRHDTKGTETPIESEHKNEERRQSLRKRKPPAWNIVDDEKDQDQLSKRRKLDSSDAKSPQHKKNEKERRKEKRKELDLEKESKRKKEKVGVNEEAEPKKERRGRKRKIVPEGFQKDKRQLKEKKEKKEQEEKEEEDEETKERRNRRQKIHHDINATSISTELTNCPDFKTIYESVHRWLAVHGKSSERILLPSDFAAEIHVLYTQIWPEAPLVHLKWLHEIFAHLSQGCVATFRNELLWNFVSWYFSDHKRAVFSSSSSSSLKEEKTAQIAQIEQIEPDEKGQELQTNKQKNEKDPLEFATAVETWLLHFYKKPLQQWLYDHKERLDKRKELNKKQDAIIEELEKIGLDMIIKLLPPEICCDHKKRSDSKCPACHQSEDITSYWLQTRSADEGMTGFHRCNKTQCGRRWRD